LPDDKEKMIKEARKLAQENVDFCTNELGYDKEQAKKLGAGDFTIRDPKSQVKFLKKN
jgi:hypothetical protein